MPTSHPIIFSAPMVRALLDGRKTQTRRLAWGRPMPGLYESSGGPLTPIPRPSLWQKVMPGDVLWVREACAARLKNDGETDENPRYVKYRADDGHGETPSDPMDFHHWPHRWSPSIHMPRWASRLTLKVMAVKIERLQDIIKFRAYPMWPGMNSWDIADLFAEGPPESISYSSNPNNYVDWFRKLWTSLHGPASWDANPEVVALTFEVIHRNVDEVT